MNYKDYTVWENEKKLVRKCALNITAEKNIFTCKFLP